MGSVDIPLRSRSDRDLAAGGAEEALSRAVLREKGDFRR
jgi:hypothetical protein